MNLRVWHKLRWLLFASALGLAGCASRPVSAPVVSMPAHQPEAAATGARSTPQGYYVVQPGDTLYSIALNHGVDYHNLARWNNIKHPSDIRTGELIRVVPPRSEVQVSAVRGPSLVQARPLGGGTPGIPPLAPQTASGQSIVASPQALRLPYSKQNLAMLSTPAPQAPNTVSPPAQASMPTVASHLRAASAQKAVARVPGAPAFMWPAQGKLLAKFSEPTNQGIDIGGTLGAPVVAAAPGRVMYTGSAIRGYGNLIVIKHDDGYNSVYAHNKVILVKEGQHVARGQEIGEIGETTGDVPMLHFEIRKSGRPVDPLKYLPVR